MCWALLSPKGLGQEVPWWCQAGFGRIAGRRERAEARFGLVKAAPVRLRSSSYAEHFFAQDDAAPRGCATRSPIGEKRGGAERNRTAGLLIANEALSQLSYSPPKAAGFSLYPSENARIKAFFQICKVRNGRTDAMDDTFSSLCLAGIISKYG